MSKEEINLNLEIKTIESKVRPLRASWKPVYTNKELYGRLPRKLKKKIKKRLGEQGFQDWWNVIFYSEVPYYDAKVAEELEHLLAKEIESEIEKLVNSSNQNKDE